MTAIVASTKDKSDALPIIFGAVIVAGLLGFLAAPFFSKAVRFFPPVVTGTVITLIGVSLLPVAFGWAQGPDPRRTTTVRAPTSAWRRRPSSSSWSSAASPAASSNK